MRGAYDTDAANFALILSRYSRGQPDELKILHTPPYRIKGLRLDAKTIHVNQSPTL